MPLKRKGSVAFWVRGAEVMENHQSHIRMIMDEPETFGVTHAYIQHTYERHGEKPGIEGQARAEIIQQATRAGWIRVRHYVDRNADYWSVQVDSVRPRIHDLRNFIHWALEQNYMSSNHELILTATDDRTRAVYSFVDGGVQMFLSEIEVPDN